MNVVKYVEWLQKRYEFWLDLYNLYGWRWLGVIASKIQQRIEDVYDSEPGLEQRLLQIQTMKERILDMFTAGDLLFMNDPQARKHIEKLIQERNNSNGIFKPYYEKVIIMTLRELRSLGIHIHVEMPRHQQWVVVPALKQITVRVSRKR